MAAGASSIEQLHHQRNISPAQREPARCPGGERPTWRRVRPRQLAAALQTNRKAARIDRGDRKRRMAAPATGRPPSRACGCALQAGCRFSPRAAIYAPSCRDRARCRCLTAAACQPDAAPPAAADFACVVLAWSFTQRAQCSMLLPLLPRCPPPCAAGAPPPPLPPAGSRSPARRPAGRSAAPPGRRPAVGRSRTSRVVGLQWSSSTSYGSMSRAPAPASTHLPTRHQPDAVLAAVQLVGDHQVHAVRLNRAPGLRGAATREESGG